MLCQNQCLWICLLHPLSEYSPEIMIIGFRIAKICRHIQSPAIHAVRRFQPFFRNMEDILPQIGRLLIIQLRQRVMPPPAVIVWIIRPFMLIIKFEKIPIRAAGRYIRSLFICAVTFIQTFPIQPFVEGAAVIENSIQNNPHAAGMHFFHKLCKVRIAGIQVFLIHHPFPIFGRMAVIQISFCQTLSAVFRDHRQMWIDIIIILRIILVIGR